MNNKFFIGAIVSIIVIAAVGIGTLNLLQTEPEPQTPATPTPVDKPQPIVRKQPEPIKPIEEDWSTPETVTEPVEPEVTIVTAPETLENSDPQFLLAITDLSPTLKQWLLPTEQIRKWVLTVDQMADGKLPKRYRPVDYPMEKFAVTSAGENKVSAEDNQARMDLLIKTITAIPPEKMAQYYQEWLPLLNEAYAEQGKGNNFNQRFQQAISQVLAAQPLPQQATLIRPSVLYQFEDPALEKANDVEKILWRLGEENTEMIQDYLRQLRHQLEEN